MADASSTWVFAAVLGGGVVVLAFIFAFYRLRLRKADVALHRDSNQSEEERAHNQIRIARAGASHLEQQGYDVTPVRALLSEADSAQKRRDHASALAISDRAKQRLHDLRRSGVAASPGASLPRTVPTAAAGARWSAPESAALTMPDESTDAPNDTSTAEASPKGKLPPNQVQARFELAELDRDLARPGGASDAAARAEAAETERSARAAYDRADYTEAWRLALRARRKLGGPVESIGISRAVAPVAPPAVGMASAALAAKGTTCPKCGRATQPGDLFCRACGATLAPGKCPRCGAKNESADRFCAVCGSPVGA